MLFLDTLTKWAYHHKTYLWTCAPSEVSDQSAHSRSLIRIFPVRSLDSHGCEDCSCGQRRLWSDCANAQADLSLVRTFRRYVFSRCGSNTFPTYMSCTVELSVFEFLASADCYLFCGFVDFLHINGQPVVKSPLETYCRLLILSRQYDPFCLL